MKIPGPYWVPMTFMKIPSKTQGTSNPRLPMVLLTRKASARVYASHPRVRPAGLRLLHIGAVLVHGSQSAGGRGAGARRC